MARRAVPRDSAVEDHIFHCSPCYATYLGVQRQIWRQRYIRRSSMWALSTLLVAFVAFYSYRLGSKKVVESPSTTSASVEVPTSIILRPGLSRAAANNESPYELLIHRGTSAVSVILRLDRDTCPMYNAIVQTADGQEVRRIEALRAESLPNIGKALVISLSSESLQNNTYQIKILGECPNRPEEFVNIYAFRVIK